MVNYIVESRVGLLDLSADGPIAGSAARIWRHLVIAAVVSDRTARYVAYNGCLATCIGYNSGVQFHSLGANLIDYLV